MLEKTVILITGANSGIGFDTAAALAAASGSNQVIMSARNPSKGAAALEALQARGYPGALSLVQLDVTSEASIAAAVEAVARSHGRLDVLVNNAGLGSRAPSFREQLRETFDTNTLGPALVTEAFLPLLKKAAAPRIVHVSSELGSIALRLDPGQRFHSWDTCAYRCSKAALNMLAANEAVMYKDWGCKVWAFDPGWVITNIDGGDEKIRKWQTESGAKSSEESAQGILAIVNGERDADAGGYVHKDGTWPW